MRALIIASVWPEPNSSAAGIRTLHLAGSLRDHSFEVIFASSSKVNDAFHELGKLGFEAFSVELNDSSFDDWVKQLAPDLVIFDRFMTEEQFGARVRAGVPSAARVIDTIDLHFLRGSRQRSVIRALKGKVDSTKTQTGQPENEDSAGGLSDESTLRELAALYRSDLSLLVSDYEFGHLVQKYGFPSNLLRVFRFGYPPAPEPRGFDARKGFGMVGNFRHPPNRDGFDWLRTEIWPRIRELLPAAEVRIHGAYPPRECMAMDSPRTGFRVLGWSPDARASLSEVRVNLAPLRFGAGIKGKISDGWWSGTPVVTTPIGAEGMAGSWPWPGAIVEDADEFARAAVRLHEEKRVWDEQKTRAQLVMAALYDQSAISIKIGHEFRTLLEELPARRASNVVGSILWHQSMRSTDYFSRWIEAKNRPIATEQ